MSDKLNIDPKRTYIMTIVYHTGRSDIRRIKGNKLAAALVKHNGKKTVKMATAHPE